MASGAAAQAATISISCGAVGLELGVAEGDLRRAGYDPGTDLALLRGRAGGRKGGSGEDHVAARTGFAVQQVADDRRGRLEAVPREGDAFGE